MTKKNNYDALALQLKKIKAQRNVDQKKFGTGGIDSKEMVRHCIQRSIITEQLVARCLEQISQQQDSDHEESMQQHFVAAVNHQLKTPLNAILGAIALLKDTLLSDGQAELLNVASQSGQFLFRQITQIADLTEIESGRVVLEHDPISTQDLVDDLIDIYAPKARQKNLRLFGSVHPDAATTIKTDPGRLRQILINLLDNAITYTKKGSVMLEVATGTDSDDNLVFSIRDTGAGIKPEDLPRLFKPFETLNESEQDDAEGVGLGLTLAQQLAHLMNGEIEAERNPKGGMTFRFHMKAEKVIADADDQLEALTRAISETAVFVTRDVTDASLLNTLRDWKFPLREIDDLTSVPAAEGQKQAIILSPKAHESQDEPAIGSEQSYLSFFYPTENPNQKSFSKAIPFPTSQRALLHLISGLPLTHDHHGVSMEKPALAQSPAAVLLVEDSMANQMIVSRMLEKMGHRVHSVSSGKEAINAVSQLKFDLILMDIKMPQMGGIQATQEILKRLGHEDSPPIVAITANELETDRSACLRAGMSDFIPKPVTANVLRETVDQWAKHGQEKRRQVTLKKFRQLPIVEYAPLRKMAKEVDATIIPEIGRQFLDELKSRLSAAASYVVEDDYNALARELHPLKSTCASFGTTQLREMVRSLEDAAKQSDVQRISELMPVVQQVAERTSDVLGEYLAEMKTA